jgi:outer membrane protein assembly factor BamB
MIQPSAELVPALRADASLVRKLEAARDALRSESWAEATRLLQGLLASPEDALVEVQGRDRDGQEILCWTGIRGEAIRLLKTLPPRGQEYFNLTYSSRARTLLAEARKQGNGDLIAEVARHYPTTPAGAEAAELLAARHLDRARFTLAALGYRHVLDRTDADRLPTALLFRSALAFRGAGDEVRAGQVWKRLATRAAAGLRLGGQAVSLADLKKALDRVSGPAIAPAPRGTVDVASLEPHWTRPTAREANTKDFLQAAVTRQELRDLPVLPTFFPLTVGNKVIYRNYLGLHAVDLKTGKETWKVPSAWSLDRLLAEPRHASLVESWVSAYLEYSPHVLFENAVLGTLATDGSRVYAVDDLAVPPYRPNLRSGRFRAEPPWPDFGPELNDAAEHNRLLALDAATGKPVWEVGGRSPKAGGLRDAYFLGPPLPLDDRLYALIEKNNEVALVCLSATQGTLLWKQGLAYAPTRLLLDPGRRIQAARPIYGDGLLVCPTNAGVVLGVDPFTQSLAWAYVYRSEPLTQSLPFRGRGRPSSTRLTAEWKAPRTLIAQGRIVFTAPDERSIHCLNLRDGSLQWKIRREEGDLYLAGIFGDKLLLVGREACRALALENGKELWRLETELPSGQGVARGHVYYLPLKEEGLEEEPAVCVIDVANGVVLTTISVGGMEPPGNLLLADGEILSQTIHSVMAFPLRKNGIKEQNGGPK